MGFSFTYQINSQKKPLQIGHMTLTPFLLQFE